MFQNIEFNALNYLLSYVSNSKKKLVLRISKCIFVQSNNDFVLQYSMYIFAHCSSKLTPPGIHPI